MEEVKIEELKQNLENIYNMSREELGLFMSEYYRESMEAEGMYFNIKGINECFLIPLTNYIIYQYLKKDEKCYNNIIEKATEYQKKYFNTKEEAEAAAIDELEVIEEALYEQHLEIVNYNTYIDKNTYYTDYDNLSNDISDYYQAHGDVIDMDILEANKSEIYENTMEIIENYEESREEAQELWKN